MFGCPRGGGLIPAKKDPLPGAKTPAMTVRKLDNIRTSAMQTIFESRFNEGVSPSGYGAIWGTRPPVLQRRPRSVQIIDGSEPCSRPSSVPMCSDSIRPTTDRVNTLVRNEERIPIHLLTALLSRPQCFGACSTPSTTMLFLCALLSSTVA